MRTMYLVNYFLAGCIASSCLGWVASLHPMTFRAITFLLAALGIIWVAAWLLDYSLSQFLKVSIQQLQAVLVSVLAVLVIGLGVILCS
ncbi:hypothetical protein QUB61_36075 [Microcoleus sp. C2D2]